MLLKILFTKLFLLTRLKYQFIDESDVPNINTLERITTLTLNLSHGPVMINVYKSLYNKGIIAYVNASSNNILNSIFPSKLWMKTNRIPLHKLSEPLLTRYLVHAYVDSLIQKQLSKK